MVRRTRKQRSNLRWRHKVNLIVDHDSPAIDEQEHGGEQQVMEREDVGKNVILDT